MATNANMKQVSFYSTAVWKAIFDALTKTLDDRAETSFTLVTHGPRNFVRDSIGADGEIDSKKKTCDRFFTACGSNAGLLRKGKGRSSPFC